MWRETTQHSTLESQWTHEELQRGQQEDESLELVRREVRNQDSLPGSKLYLEKGLIYRQWIQPV